MCHGTPEKSQVPDSQACTLQYSMLYAHIHRNILCGILQDIGKQQNHFGKQNLSYNFARILDHCNADLDTRHWLMANGLFCSILQGKRHAPAQHKEPS